MAKYKFRCKFCQAGFVTEDRFLKHRCKEMERDEIIRTPTGQAAWEHYKTWLNLQRRQPPNVQTFLSSKFFTTFIKFTEFSLRVSIPNPQRYIAFMIKKEIPPVLWCNDEIYGEYLRYLDKATDPLERTQQTIEFLFKLADEIECPVDRVFDYLTPNDVIQLLHQRKLFPWFLLYSPKFKHFVKNAPTEQRVAIASFLDPNTWAKRSKEQPKIKEQLETFVRELNL